MLRSLPALLLLGLLPGCILAIGVDGDHDDESGWHVASFRRDGRSSSARVVSGHVRDAGGKPCGAVRVVAVYPSSSYSQTSDADGRFALGPLPEGAFTLKASSLDGGVAVLSELSLAGGQAPKDLELVLEPGATLVVSCEGLGTGETARCAIFHDGLRVEDFTLRKDGAERTVVPAGRLPLQLYRGERVFAACELDVAPGSTTPVVLRAR